MTNWNIFDASRTDKGNKLNWSAHVEWETEQDQNALHASKVSKWWICDILRRVKGIQFKFSGYVEKLYDWYLLILKAVPWGGL